MPMAVFLQSASMPMVGRHYLNLTPHSQFVCPYFCFCLFSLCYSSPPVSSSPLSYFVIPLLVFGRTYLDSFFRRSCFSYCNSGFPKPGNIRQFKRMRTFRQFWYFLYPLKFCLRYCEILCGMGPLRRLVLERVLPSNQLPGLLPVVSIG